jgi:hypothetical protein
MRMKDFRKELKHVPDKWPVIVADKDGRLHVVTKYLIAAELGDLVVLQLGEEVT